MRIALVVALCLALAACSDEDEPAAVATPTPTATATTSPSPAACRPFAGPPDGSAERPYLKRSMALECREDVRQLQAALGLPPAGFFDFETAAAVMARQEPYDCITADDGQVGPQTWSLIVEGTEPCAGGVTPPPAPGWARCGSAEATWALRAEDGTVLRRCADELVLVHAGTTHTSAVRELGTSVCAEFEDAFTADTRTTLCVSNPRTVETLRADPTTGEGEPVWRAEVAARFVSRD